MPRIPDEILDSIAFIYESRVDAEDQNPTGACGFVVGVPFDDGTDGTHLYVVTNRHVADAPSNLTTRFQRHQKTGYELVEIDRTAWVKPQDGNDVAVVPIDFGWATPPCSHIDVERLDIGGKVEKGTIGPGNDVYGVVRALP